MAKKNIFGILFCVLIFSSCFNSLNAAESYIRYEENNNPGDSLVLKKNNSDKTVVIKSGEKIIIWWGKSFPLEGNFKKIQNDTLTITINNLDNKVHTDQIETIRTFKGNLSLSRLVKVLGILFLAYSLISLAAMIAMGGVSAGIFPYLIITAIPVFLLFRLGNNIKVPRYKLKKKWRII